jgi:hypothetical protein
VCGSTCRRTRPSVAPGIDAILRVPELPDREFPGTVKSSGSAQFSGWRGARLAKRGNQRGDGLPNAPPERKRGEQSDAPPGGWISGEVTGSFHLSGRDRRSC